MSSTNTRRPRSSARSLRSVDARKATVLAYIVEEAADVRRPSIWTWRHVPS